MQFKPALIQTTFLRRYKRFFADVALPDGRVLVTHCPNTGSLRGCLREGAPAAIEPAANPARKLRYTWKMVRLDGSWVGVDTSCANALVREALEAGLIPELADHDRIVPEVKYGLEGRSRIDLLLSSGGSWPSVRRGPRALPVGDRRVYVEVKNTTLVYDRPQGRVAAFPDAVTERGRKHLADLVATVEAGHRAAMVFSVQRSDCIGFVPADDIDPAYGRALRAALAAGVEAYALGATIDPGRIELDRLLPIAL